MSINNPGLTQVAADVRYVRTVNSVGPDASGNVVVSGGGGGSVSISTATITLPYAKTYHDVTVIDATITPTTKLIITWGSHSELDENAPEMDAVAFGYTAGTGSFDLDISTAGRDKIGGVFVINYLKG